MKKSIFIPFLFILFLLSGCFGFFKKQAPASVAPASVVPAPQAQNGHASGEQLPSFQDGDYYLQAIAAGSTDLCRNIKSPQLKQRCRNDVTETARQ